jgi:nucleotide-binding universal stress UspA family protein
MIGVVYAYPAVSSWMGHPFHDQAVRTTQYDGRRILERAAIAAEDSAAEISLEMHEGQPAEVLGRIASLRGADEIVIGTRGLGRLRAALGSVSQELLRKADRPVLVVPASNPA